MKDKKGDSIVDAFQKKGDSIADAFQKILDKSACKPNKKRGDKGMKFYYNSFKKWLKDNDIEMYLIHKEGKSAVAERLEH